MMHFPLYGLPWPLAWLQWTCAGLVLGMVVFANQYAETEAPRTPPVSLEAPSQLEISGSRG